jgi:hypothetical protein
VVYPRFCHEARFAWRKEPSLPDCDNTTEKACFDWINGIMRRHPNQHFWGWTSAPQHRSTQLVHPKRKTHVHNIQSRIPSQCLQPLLSILPETRILAAISSAHSLRLACIHSRVTPADHYHVQIPSTGKCLVAAIQPKYEFEKSTISSASSAAVLMAESTRPKPRIENSLVRIRTAHTRNASFLPSRSEALVKPIYKC